jgi:hypothetical protein
MVIDEDPKEPLRRVARAFCWRATSEGTGPHPATPGDPKQTEPIGGIADMTGRNLLLPPL